MTVDSRLENMPSKDDFNLLINSVDGLATQVKTYNDERAVEGARLDRIEKWIKKASSKINVPIKF